MADSDADIATGRLCRCCHIVACLWELNFQVKLYVPSDLRLPIGKKVQFYGFYIVSCLVETNTIAIYEFFFLICC